MQTFFGVTLAVGLVGGFGLVVWSARRYRAWLREHSFQTELHRPSGRFKDRP